MAATVEIDERNGAPAGTLTHAITNTNWGSTDAVNLDPAAFPVTVNTNSYEKWQQWHVMSMGGSVSVRALTIDIN